MFNRPYKKTRHTTWTLCLLYKLLRHITLIFMFISSCSMTFFLQVRVKHFNMRDFSKSFKKYKFPSELKKRRERKKIILHIPNLGCGELGYRKIPLPSVFHKWLLEHLHSSWLIGLAVVLHLMEISLLSWGSTPQSMHLLLKINA